MKQFCVETVALPRGTFFFFLMRLSKYEVLQSLSIRLIKLESRFSHLERRCALPVFSVSIQSVMKIDR